MAGLTEQLDPDVSSVLGALRGFIGNVSRTGDLDTVLTDSLDALIELFAADRGIILARASDGTPYPIHARKLKRRLQPDEQAQISRTTILRVMETGEVVARDPSALQGTDSGDTFGITGILAGPLLAVSWGPAGAARPAGDRDRSAIRGVVYLDFRSLDKLVQPAHIEFFRVAIELLSLVLDHHERWRQAQEHLTLAALLESRPPADDDGGTPELTDLLRPASMAEVRRQLLPVVATDTPVLMLGESGTGKTFIARAIAAASQRPRPFVRANLGRFDDRNTVISELFGHVKGAYTGAVADRVGKVERADGGTLFLDEILNLPVAVQPLLLDLLQDGTYEPLGWSGSAPKRANIRVIAATNGDLAAAVRRGDFRLDVYYRLAGAVIRLPSLRERREDVPVLAEQFLKALGGARKWKLAAALRELLASPGLPWSGNIRQLQHLVAKAIAKALASDPAATALTPDLFDRQELLATEAADIGMVAPPAGRPAVSAVIARVADDVDEKQLGATYARVKDERDHLDDLERRLLEIALRKHDGVIAWAAEEVGMPRTGFASRMKTLGVDMRPPRRRRAASTGS
ncbi:MAG: sigma 54-interacting transcriptional regulator [Candidatus Schekmanbacteria bacterium]|nr:sigma 54-interacting transcriptional regulator [Candidatus Schekmanbacteria bacterium]